MFNSQMNKNLYQRKLLINRKRKLNKSSNNKDKSNKSNNKKAKNNKFPQMKIISLQKNKKNPTNINKTIL